MTPRLLPLLLLVALPVGAQEDLSWLKKSVPACSDGAVSAACKCDGVKLTTGYCCSGVAQAGACHDGLFGNPAGNFDHVWWNGTAIQDTKGLPWAMTGTVPQIQASGSIPAGAGPYSTANLYSVAAANKGGWAITGDHWFCAAFKLTTLANASLTTNGAYTSIAQATSGHAQAAFTGGSPASLSGANIAGGLNVVCWGQAGTKGRITVNGDPFVEGNVSAVVSPTADNVLLGRPFSMAGSLHEIVGVNGTPTEALWRPYVFSVLAANGNKLILTTGDSIAYGTGASRPYTALLADALNDGWVTTNRAVGGTSVFQNRAAWDAYVEGTPAAPWKILTIEGGYNDLNQARTQANLIADYTYIMDRARALGMKIIVVGFLPFGRNSLWTQAKEDIRTAVNSALDTYAANHPDDVVVIDRASITEAGVNIPIAWDWTDGVHWNQTGHSAGLEPAVYAAGHAKGWF